MGFHASQRSVQALKEHVPLNPSASAILRRMSQHKTGIHLFPGRDPGTARTTLRNAWRQVCKNAELATQSAIIGKRGDAWVELSF